MPDTSWTPALVDEGRLQFRVGTSIVEQFASGHDFAAVFRELVQNEYDAGGPRLEVDFGREGLRVVGTGQSIDAHGWRRLSVVLGTGRVAGTDEAVRPKVNGIGSKNFGLRSLFLIGDTIHVRSAGRYNVLSATRGTYPEPVPDPSSHGTPGVQLYVPFRGTAAGVLAAFDENRELDALEALAAGLGPTLTKLASAGGRSGLSRVEVRSERHQRELVWTQKATAVGCGVRGVHALRRSMSLRDSKGKERTTTEIEFSRFTTIPDQFRNKGFALYYARARNRLAIAVSLKSHRNRIDLAAIGGWFYPIGVTGQSTGNCVSISAPFEMNNDRSAIVATEVNDWNKWLSEEAAALVADLLPADWWKRFGVDAYVAVQESTPPSDPHYNSTLKRLLAERPLWPTRTSGRQQQFGPARDLVVPDHVALDGVLAEQQYAPMAATQSPRFSAAMRVAGSKPFGINSFIRLRCAGRDQSKLATKLDPGAANFYLPDYPTPLTKIEVQLAHASALDAVQRRLSANNRRDLRETATTLTASGELRAASQLQRVPESIADACPLPANARLHPALLQSRVLRQLTGEYRPEAWMLDVAERALNNAADDDERQSVYRFLRARHGHISARLLAAFRRTPIVQDRRGDWVLPSDLVQSRTLGANELASVLRFPDPRIERDRHLVRALRIRNRLSAGDLVAYAKLVASEQVHSIDFERALLKFRSLLTSGSQRELSALAILPSSQGGMAAPSELYVRTPRLVHCLGDDAPFAASDLPSALLAQIGCRSQPKVADMVAHLERLASENHSLESPDMIYRELGRAMDRERTQPTSLNSRKVLWTDSGWAAPMDAILGTAAGKLPQGAVPRTMSVGAESTEVYLRLGVHWSLQSQHWHKVLGWAGATFGDRGTIPKDIRRFVRDAYVQLADNPGEFEPAARVLLDRHGRLWPLQAARTGHFVIDDAPPLADALEHDRAPIAFADIQSNRALRFYHALGVTSLRECRRSLGVESGEASRPPARVRLEEIARRATDPALPSALGAFFASRCRRRPGVALPRSSDMSRRLSSLRQLTFVSELQEVYRVTGHTVRVPVRAHDDGQRVLLCEVRSTNEAVMVVADAMAPALPTAEGFEWADVLFRILSCETVEEMRGFLRDRGVAWNPPRSPEHSSEDETADEIAGAVEEALERAVASVTTNLTDPLVIQNVPPREDPPALALPPLALVEPLVVASTGAEISLGRGVRVAGGGSGVPSSRADERDQSVGDRGEEIVYGLERERLRAAGMDPDLVVWTSRIDPMSAHDIRTVDSNGNALWIEVKSTTGWDGRFRWSRAEFDLARQERSRYVLTRVYGADTLHPVVKHFPDPVALLLKEQIRLDITQLQAEVEAALSTPGPTTT